MHKLTILYGDKSSWVAKLNGTSSTWTYERCFLQPDDIDGDNASYELSDGLYEVQPVKRQTNRYGTVIFRQLLVGDRYFLKVLAGEATKVSRTLVDSEFASQNTASSMSLGLPALKGTPKQVAWAEKIRQPYAPRWIARANSMRLESDRRPYLWRDCILASSELFAAGARQDEARWWIDHRDVLGRVEKTCNAPIENEELVARIYGA
jgi:hypothetical protein